MDNKTRRFSFFNLPGRLTEVEDKVAELEQEAGETIAIAQLPTGTSASTVALGNHNHAITADAASGLSAAANLQALAVALSARIKALEDAAV